MSKSTHKKILKEKAKEKHTENCVNEHMRKYQEKRHRENIRSIVYGKAFQQRRERKHHIKDENET